MRRKLLYQLHHSPSVEEGELLVRDSGVHAGKTADSAEALNEPRPTSHLSSLTDVAEGFGLLNYGCFSYMKEFGHD